MGTHLRFKLLGRATKGEQHRTHFGFYRGREQLEKRLVQQLAILHRSTLPSHVGWPLANVGRSRLQPANILTLVGRADLRRGMNGHCGVIPHAGGLFVFRGARGDLIKIIWHDGLDRPPVSVSFPAPPFKVSAAPWRVSLPAPPLMT